ncbi:hypothetical protein NS220_08920 [Microbacterium testaceum]|uniref:PEP-utilising enzyme mobile domain-containing protein n=1 Tax=Microbacterium testaceum TaxID=2033 RepID=A0A147EX73_MICTE|nr:PEP-utilizing enzyme [Microbacterium testaceum]KTR94518.1 hypothetical protein NS220_08920 [Microbacterium testaceum]
MTTVEFDTPFLPNAIYTRANAGEVFPYVLEPLTWSFLGPQIERGFMRCMADDFAAATPIPGGYRACGRMAGRLHLNLSVFRTVAERAPGSTARDLDVQYFGDAVASGLPAHPTGTDTVGDKARTTTAALRTMLTVDRRIRREKAAAIAALDDARRAAASLDDPVVLLDRFDRILPLYGDTFGTHVTARALTSSAVTMATGALGRIGVGQNEAIALISRLPDLESAKPSARLRAIAVRAAADPRVADVLRRAGARDELDAIDSPTARETAAAIDAFVAEFGHRGVNEFDPTAPVWGTDPSLVRQLLRHGLADADAPRQAEDPGLRGVAGMLVRRARAAIVRAETTKDNVIRTSHALRVLLGAALERMPPLDRATALALTYPQLRAVAAGGAVPREDADRRRAELAAVRDREPAEWSIGTLSFAAQTGNDTATTDDAGLAEIAGLAGSPGCATARVRVLRSADDDFDDGDVIVARVTDTAWTPLFLAASAIVTDSGGSFSHATIVARELGIPAVVNTKTATLDLRDGDLVEVDGDAGVVRIIERTERA